MYFRRKYIKKGLERSEGPFINRFSRKIINKGKEFKYYLIRYWTILSTCYIDNPFGKKNILLIKLMKF